MLRTFRAGRATFAPVERLALATTERGLVRATVVTGGPERDVLDVFGLLVGGCETVTDEIVRRVVSPPPGTLCAEVQSP